MHVLISEEPGQNIFENPTGRSMQLWITETVPNETENCIRDISVVREDYLKKKYVCFGQFCLVPDSIRQMSIHRPDMPFNTLAAS